MQRLRLYDLRNSRLPSLLGICQSNVYEVANVVNTVQRRLLYAPEAGDESWYGTWAEILFYVSQDTPYITLPREIARLEAANVCNQPVDVNNQFVEYLRFGNGRMPKCLQQCDSPLQAYSRNNAITSVDLTGSDQYITAFITSDQDIAKKAFISGKDGNDNVVYSQAGSTRVSGEYLSLEIPFSTTTNLWNQITGIQKDVTSGPVSFYQTDPTTGEQILLLTMQPGETTASYRRYYFNSLPRTCCASASTDSGIQQIPVTALAKLDLVPATVDTDYLLIQDMEAIINEAQSMRLAAMDTESAQKMSLKLHKDAIKSLNGQLTHYIGSMKPAVNLAVFGSAKLERQRIGAMI